MKPVTVVAKVIAKPDAIGSLKSELLKLVEPTRHEQGCIEYRLHQENTDPAVFIFYENWENMACLKQHMESVHIKTYIESSQMMIAERTVHLLTEQ